MATIATVAIEHQHIITYIINGVLCQIPICTQYIHFKYEHENKMYILL